MSKTTTQEPVFESTYNALQFAFHFSDQQYAESHLTKLLKRNMGSGKGLVALDGAAQAGMILAAVERLEPILHAVIVARFSPKFEDCPCCGGNKMREPWKMAVERLTAWANPAGISHLRARRALVGKFFGIAGVEFKALSEQCGVNRKVLSEQYCVISTRLKGAEAKAQGRLDDELRERGVVG